MLAATLDPAATRPDLRCTVHLGAMEILLILGLALLFFGPTRLPALGQSLGSAVRSFKKGISGEPEEPEKQLPPSQNVPPQV